MGWSIGYDKNWQRDVGYGVPAICDFPKCNVEIDRGLGHVCGSDPYGGEFGCGLYFCTEHLTYRKPRGHDSEVQNCDRCLKHKNPFKPKPDTEEWTNFKLTDESWAEWRKKQGIKEAKCKKSNTA